MVNGGLLAREFDVQWWSMQPQTMRKGIAGNTGWRTRGKILLVLLNHAELKTLMERTLTTTTLLLLSNKLLELQEGLKLPQPPFSEAEENMSRLEAEVARLLNLFSTACNMDTARKEGCPKCTSIDVCLAIL